MNSVLLQPEIQLYIIDNLNEDPHALALKPSPFEGVSMPEIAAQIGARKRIRTKLPSLYNQPGVLFPPQLNLEQSSSEQTAAFKANLLKGSTLIDLTGGFGIDVMAFAEKFENVTYCEHNEELAEIAAHNFKTLGKENIEVYTGNGIDLIEGGRWDVIYCDPDRRTTAKRAYRLADCEPNIEQLEEKLLQHCDSLWIKAAPMLDIGQAKTSLKHLDKILVVAVKGEVKELLLCCKKVTMEVTECAINLFDDQVSKDKIHDVSDVVNYSTPLSYLYLAHGALMKLQAYSYIAEKYGVSKLAQSSHIFTSEQLKDFPGRRFGVKAIHDYNKRTMSSFKGQPCLVIAKNFPMNVAQLRQKWKLKDAGNDYLIFTTLHDGQKVVIEASQL